MQNNYIYLTLEWFLFVNLVILGIITFLKSNKKSTNNAIVYVYASFLVHILFNISIITGFIEKLSLFIFLDELDGYIFAIAIVHHIIDVTKVKINLKILYSFAIISSVASFIYYYNYLSSDVETQRIFIESLKEFKLTKIFKVPMFFILLNNLIAVIYLIIILNKFKIRVKNYFSDNTMKTKQYVNSFVIIYILLIFSYSIFVLFFSSKLVQFGLIPIVVYFFFFIASFVYMGIPIFEFTQNMVIAQVKNEKNEQNDIIDLIKLKNNIETIITEKQLYKNPNFTLFDLAKELSVNSKQLSNFLNVNLKTNFSTYINIYRVNEVKRLLQEKKHKHLTLEAIAELAGFNNRITFYRVFKKIEKISPSDYKV